MMNDGSRELIHPYSMRERERERDGGEKGERERRKKEGERWGRVGREIGGGVRSRVSTWLKRARITNLNFM